MTSLSSTCNPQPTTRNPFKLRYKEWQRCKTLLPTSRRPRRENRLEYLAHAAELDAGLGTRVAAVVVVLGLAVVVVDVVRVGGVVGVGGGGVARVGRVGDVAAGGLLLEVTAGRDFASGVRHGF